MQSLEKSLKNSFIKKLNFVKTAGMQPIAELKIGRTPLLQNIPPTECIYIPFQVRNYSGRWGGLPCPLLKIEKIPMILEKKAKIASIFELNFPFKMQFHKYLGERIVKFFHVELFILLLMKNLWKCPNFTKPPLPWKISGCASACIF